MKHEKPHRIRSSNAMAALCLALPLLTGALCGLGPSSPEQDAGWQDAGPPPVDDAGPPRLPDETPPTLALVAPVAGCLTGDVRFVAKAIDAEAGIGVVAMKFASRTLNVEPIGDGVYQADFYVGTLLTGTYVLVVTAIDQENNRTELEQRFGVAQEGEYLQEEGIECGTPPPPPPVDETPPLLELLSPSPLYTTYVGERLSLTISVEDEIGPVEAFAELGGLQTLIPGVARLRSVEIPTSDVLEGPYILRIIAVDAAGNESSLTHEVIVDHTPPQVMIASPLQGNEVAAFTDVVADVVDDHGIARVRLYETGVSEPLGSALLPSAGARWGVIYRLPCEGLPRDVTFSMQAEDYAQNVGTAEVNVRVLSDGCANE